MRQNLCIKQHRYCFAIISGRLYVAWPLSAVVAQNKFPGAAGIAHKKSEPPVRLASIEQQAAVLVHVLSAHYTLPQRFNKNFGIALIVVEQLALYR